MAEAAGLPSPPRQRGGDGLIHADYDPATTSPDIPTLETDSPGKVIRSCQSEDDSPHCSPSSSPDILSGGSPAGSMEVEENVILIPTTIYEDKRDDEGKLGIETLDLREMPEEVSRELSSIDPPGMEDSDGEIAENEMPSRKETDRPPEIEGAIEEGQEGSRQKQEFEARMEEVLERERNLGERLAAADIRILELEKDRDGRKYVLAELSISIRRACDVVHGILKKLPVESPGVIQESGDGNNGDLNLDTETRDLVGSIKYLNGVVTAAETAFMGYEEKNRKEKKELENSVVSLTEEARDIGVLLKVALAEKEAAERSLNKLKGGGGEQKRVAILQIAERGLQRVGFGFMMGSGASEPDSNGVVSSGTKVEGNESEEEVVSLASTIENMMKNLRLEISELRKSLDESRADNERLQQLTEKQAQKLSENHLYIKDLEERENMLTQNVEELMMEITEVEEDVVRWREACELEVEAGKSVIQQYDKESATLQEELETTRASLDLANNKLKLKEELAFTAMAAQEAAEKSLRLADTRSAILHERIEELTKQLEAVESRGDNSLRRRIRHVCWPWEVLKAAPGVSRRRPSRRRLSDMEGLLHYPA
ncbi:Uncharacterized protein EJ110_NYTH49595 [Nymphaea thermarum]|nr:Uncharacterized protein EJ110_NYTH49595 [Nymphaea thermarum]